MRLLLLWMFLARGPLQEPGTRNQELSDPGKAIRDAWPALDKGTVPEAWAAVERLSRLGPGAIPEIRRQSESAPAHVRRRLLAVVDEIEAERDLKEHYARPKRFSLSGKERSVQDFLLELKRESGETLDLSEFEEAPGKNATLDLKDVTFFEALDALCRAGEVRIMYAPSLYLTSAPYDEAPRFFFRNFMIRATNVTDVRIQDFSGGPRRRLRVELEVYWESKAAPMRLLPEVVLEEAVDDQGRDLRLAPEFSPYTEPIDRTVTTPGMLEPSEGAQKIARLSGRLQLEYPRAGATAKFDKIEPGAKKTEGGFAIELGSIRPTDEGFYSGSLHLRPPKEWKGDPEKLRLKISLVTSDNRELQGTATFDKKSGEDFLYTVQVQDAEAFEDEENTEPVKSLTVQLVHEVAVKSLRFELRDIPLKKP